MYGESSFFGKGDHGRDGSPRDFVFKPFSLPIDGNEFVMLIVDVGRRVGKWTLET